jgi:hypothetical protein
VSKGQTYLRGLGQRLRGEEKHAELEMLPEYGCMY